jgi:hypothetical protein
MTDGTTHSIAPFMLQGYTSTLHSPTTMALGLIQRLCLASLSVSRGWFQVQLTD